jgi:hypothetical protein
VLQAFKSDSSSVRETENSQDAKSKVCNQDAPVEHNDSTVGDIARQLQDATVFEEDDASILALEDRLIQGSEDTVLVTTDSSQGSDSPIHSITKFNVNLKYSNFSVEKSYRSLKKSHILHFVSFAY